MNGVPDRAVLVGLEAFEWLEPLKGPAGEILRTAEWLLARGMPGSAITVLCAPYDDRHDERIARLRESDCEVRGGSADEVHAVLNGLGDVPGGDLFVYWSGHGFQYGRSAVFTFPESRPEAFAGLPVDDLLTWLGTREVGIPRQLIIADACRTRPGRALPPIQRRDLRSGHPADHDQLVLYAVSEGRRTHAHPHTDSTRFGELVHKALGDLPAGGWPPELGMAFGALTGGPDAPVLAYSRMRGREQRHERPTDPTTARTELRRTLYRLLSEVERLEDEDIRALFANELRRASGGALRVRITPSHPADAQHMADLLSRRRDWRRVTRRAAELDVFEGDGDVQRIIDFLNSGDEESADA